MKDAAAACLAALAVVQVGLLWDRASDPQAVEAGGIRPGDQLGEIDAIGATIGKPTLVLVFHSSCAHTAVVTPAWRSWLEDHVGKVQVLAVSAEPLESARRYAVNWGWGVEVLSLQDSRRGSTEHALTSRTPWLFALDAHGIVVAEGHGRRIEEIGAVLLDHLRAQVAVE